MEGMKEAFFRDVVGRRNPRYGDFQRGQYSGVLHGVVTGIKNYVTASGGEKIDGNEALVAIRDVVDGVAETRTGEALKRSGIKDTIKELDFHDLQKPYEVDRILQESTQERIIVQAGDYILNRKPVAERAA